jgi:tape measure domain-containing protein
MNDDQKVYLRIELDTSQIPKAKQETVQAIKGMGDAVKDYIGVEHSELTQLAKEFAARKAQFESVAKSIGVTVAELKKLISMHQQAAAAADRAGVAQERQERRLAAAKARELAEAHRHALEVTRIENQTATNARKEADVRIKAADDIVKAQNRINAVMSKQNQADFARNAGGSGGLFRNFITSGGNGGGISSSGSGGSGGGASGALNSFFGGAGGSGGEAEGLGEAAGAIGAVIAALELLKAAMGAIWTLAKQGASAWLQYSANLEQARIGFKTLMGSADAANAHIQELQKFSVSTPFQFDDLVQASRTLQAMGTAAKDVIPELTAIGNAAAAAGGDFQSTFQGAAYAFAEIQSQGKLTGKEVRQLAANGIPVVQALSTELGKTNQETIKLIKSGKISAEVFIGAFKTFSANRFGDAMKEQSKTFLGSLSNIKDALLIQSEISFRPLFDVISKISNAFADEITGADGITGVVTGAASALGDAGHILGVALIDGMIDVIDSDATRAKIYEAIYRLSLQTQIVQGLSHFFGEKTPLDMVDARRKSDKLLDDTIKLSLEKGKHLDESLDFNKLLGDDEKKSKVKSEFEQLSIKLRELTKDIKGFLETGSREFKLRIKVEDATRFKADLESIISLRRELSLPLDAPLPKNGTAVKTLLNDLQSFKRVNDDVRSAQDESLKANEALAASMLKSGIPVVDAATRASIAYNNQLRERRNEEEQLTADLDLMVKKRGALLNSEAANIRNSYTRLRIEVFKQNDDARLAEIKAKLRRLISEGSEESIIADVRKQLEITVKNQAPTVLGTISTAVQKILDALTKGKVENPQGSNKTQEFGDGRGRSGALPTTGRFASQGFNQNFEGGLEALFTRLEASGLHPSIRSGVRTSAQQRSLFMRGKPTPYDGSIGNESVHQLGGAADISFGRGERASGVAAIAEFVRQNPQFLQAGFVKNRFGKSIDDRGHFALRREFLNGFGEQSASASSTHADLFKNFFNGSQGIQSGIETDRSGKGATEFSRISGESEDTSQRLTNAKFNDKLTDTRENITRLKQEEAKWGDKIWKSTYDTLKLDEARGLKKEALRAAAEEENRNIILLNDELRDATNKNADWTEKVQRHAIQSHLEAQIAAKEQIVTLQYDIAHASEGSADRYAVAWLEAIKEVQGRDEEAVKSMIRSQVELADQQSLHSDRIRADVYEHAAQAKSISQIISGAFISSADAIGDGFSKMFGVLTEKLGAAGKIINDIATSLLRMVTNRLLMRLVDSLFGGASQQASSGGSGGGLLGAIAGGIGGIFGAGRTVTPAGVGEASLLGGLTAAGLIAGGGLNQFAGQVFGQNNTAAGIGGLGAVGSSTLQTLSGQAASRASAIGALGGSAAHGIGGAGALGSLTGSLASASPLLGLTLGAGLGGAIGGTGFSGAIGSIGGGLLGGAAGVGIAGLLSPGIFAAGGGLAGFAPLAGLLTNPLTIIAGGALLLGAYFLNKSKQRKKDEATRAQLLGDAESQLDTLITKVRAHQMDGQEALAASATIRQSYLDAGAQIKDKKTRLHHMQDVSRLDIKIAALRAAASQSANEQQIFEQFTPAFATGGIVPGQRGTPRLVLAHGGEIISSLSQQTPAFLQAAAQAGVPGVAGTTESSTGRHGNIHLELSLGTNTQDQLFVNGAKSDKGYNAQIDNFQKAKRNREF